VVADAALAVGLPCAAAVRAEQIRIAQKRRSLDGLETVVDGQVVDCIFEGERVVYEIRVPGLAGVLMRVFDHDPESHLQFGPGEEVRLGWNARDMHVFQK
jgi:putative spermidine/putrescine transport system ATP-binding protein